MSSDTPKDMEPMKSFLVVRSQSHTSMDRRRSLSDAFSLLRTHTHKQEQSLTLFPLMCVKQKNQQTQTRRLDLTHKVKDSFQQGLRDERMVLVFCLVSFFGSGMSLSFTYGSDKPFGSIGIKFLASPTGRRGEGRKMSTYVCLSPQQDLETL